MLQRFVKENQHVDVAQLALQRSRYPMLSDSDFRFGLQQIDGRRRTRDKLPTFATIDGWLYPPRLNLEQCSSERTARFKASLLSSVHLSSVPPSPVPPFTLIDATGGFGVDTFFMSDEAKETHYFEQNADLAAMAEHNFALAGKSIHCHAQAFDTDILFNLVGGKSEESASKVQPKSIVLYLDPARRDANGGKVFRLEDCTPNVCEIVRFVQRKCPTVRVLLKLSPMLDIRQAVLRLGGSWDVYILSIANEVKELLLLSDGTNAINAVSLDDAGAHILTFTAAEESRAEAQFVSNSLLFERGGLCSLSETLYLYEPDAAILKAGAFRLLSARYGLKKADRNTHLYLADTREAFAAVPLPGRMWQIVAVYTRAKEVQRALTRANVLARNYVLPADVLRKQLRLKDGGDDYIIGCIIAGKPLLLHCRRI